MTAHSEGLILDTSCCVWAEGGHLSDVERLVDDMTLWNAVVLNGMQMASKDSVCMQEWVEQVCWQGQDGALPHWNRLELRRPCFKSLR